MWIDTHCHLDPAYFPEGAHAVAARAADANVHGLVVIGVGDTLEPARAACALAREYPQQFAATAGVHPHDATTLAASLLELERLAADPAIVAIGETGLDYHYDQAPREVQRAAFAAQIALARGLNKPIVVHTRSAAADTLELLVSERAHDIGGIIHCFSEDVAFARQALDLGFYLSFSGILTFKRSDAIAAACVYAPLERLLLETDSPYLAPAPFRGKPCEPALLPHTASKMAALRGTDLDELAHATTANAERVFRHSFARKPN
jgi:TatD DNase family protein